MLGALPDKRHNRAMTWVFLLFAAACALLYGLRWAASRTTSAARSTVKTASVACLALAGLTGGAPAPVVVGLALGAVGDFLLSRQGEGAFLGGMAAFAAGHLAYALAFGAGMPGWPVLIALGLLATSTEAWLAPHTGALRWPVRGYVLVICAMATLAAARSEPLLRLGAALFVASDLMLALEIFVIRAPARPRLLCCALWPAYWGGQALILWALLP